MKKILVTLFILLLVCELTAIAQKFTIRGQMTDTLSQPLPSATVLLLNPKDSSLVNFAVANTQGVFEIKNVGKGKHLFKVAFVGFRSYTKEIQTHESSFVIELGQIKMRPAINDLEAIEIAAEKSPVTVKHDTVEFNAGSFKTKPNAVVEDLLKKLPGVEVDNDGNITAQGEQVRRVTVDGKNFFGSDPKLASKNLPADAVNKVQVFDKKSDQAAFSGIDDGQREKTINLELKEEKRNGAFGTMAAGAGTNDRFQTRANLNKFSKGQQLSFLGMANNINEQGFSMEDYMNFTGGAQQIMAGGGRVRMELNSDNANGIPLNFGNRANGIMTNYAGGLNVNNEFSKKTEINGSYFYNYLDHNKDQTTLRENFLPSGNFTFNENTRQRNTNLNHRINFTLDHKLDSLNSLKLTTIVNYNQTDSEVTSQSENLTPDNTLQNQSKRLSLSNSSNTMLNSTLLWRHKFKKKGRNFSTNFQLGVTENQREGLLDAVNDFYGLNPRQEIITQTNDQSTQYKSYGATISYTEPLGKRKYFEANYNYRQNVNDVNRIVYDVNNDGSVFNSSLSNDYLSNYQYHRGGLNFRMNKSNYHVVVGASLQRTQFKGDLRIHDVEIDRSFQNVLPSLRLNYDFSNSKHLNFNYETAVQEPSIQELQPVLDNSDPLNIYTGNPQLRPAYSQSWRLNFTTFDPVTLVSFFSFIDVDYITNAITNAQTVDENLLRTTSPVNVNNNLSVNSNAIFSFPISRWKSRFSLGGNYRKQRTINILNEEPNIIHQRITGVTSRYNFRYKEIFDLSLSADLDHQLTDYEFDQPDQIFINSTYAAETNFTILKNYQLAANLEYLNYENQVTNFSQSIPLLNMSVSRFLLKNKSGELKFSVNNMLDKTLGINQTANINYLERQTINSLGRYFIISFTYALNKQLNPMNMRRGGGIMRVIR